MSELTTGMLKWIQVLDEAEKTDNHLLGIWAAKAVESAAGMGATYVARKFYPEFQDRNNIIHRKSKDRIYRDLRRMIFLIRESKKIYDRAIRVRMTITDKQKRGQS